MSTMSDYLKDISDFISDEKEVISLFKNAIKCLDEKTEESFVCFFNEHFNGDPKEFIAAAIGTTEIVIEGETVLDIGDEKPQLKKLNKVIKDYDREPYTCRIEELFDWDEYMEEGFLEEYNGKLYINDAFECGRIADAISDKTDFLVQSVSYHLR